MNILIVDDHSIIRKGLKAILLKEFYAAETHEAGDGICAVEMTHDYSFDIILLDINMPFLNGLDALKQMRAEDIHIPILMVSLQPENPYAIQSLQAGASGYITKACTVDELLCAVHKVLSGHKYVSDHVAEELAQLSYNNNHSSHELSTRESEVFEMMTKGKSVSEIAKEKHLSVNTISTYRARILEKLNLHSTAEMMRYAWNCKQALTKNIVVSTQPFACQLR